MPDLIDRGHYCRSLCKCDDTKCDKDKCPIWAAPSVDAVPVVRCKDCVCSSRLRDQLVCARISGGMDGYCYGNSDIVKPEDYCSFGIRQRAMPLDAKTDGA